MTGRIHVCSMANLHRTAAAIGAGSLMTLLAPANFTCGRPPTIDAANHVTIGVSDISGPLAGFVHPEPGHVEQMLAFFARWERSRPLLIHCYAGVSRSPAAAFIGLCALAPERDEAEIAGALRQASPTATPNAGLVALADATLGRQGRMIRAIEAIGRGVDCFKGAPFGLEVGA